MIYISRTSKLLAARSDITTPHLLIEAIIVTGSTSRLAACNPFGYRVKKNVTSLDVISECKSP